MKGRARIATFLFYTFSGLMIVICVISFVGAVSWVNKPFAGFLSYQEPLVGTINNQAWPGPKAGLKFLERIVAVDGQPVRSGQDLIDAAGRKKPGTAVQYVVESGGKTREVSLPITIFSIKDFFLIFFITFLGGVILFALGVIVYVLKPTMRSSWVFFFVCISIGAYMVTSPDTQTTYLLNHINTLTLCFFPATVFHLFLIFPDKKRILVRMPNLEYVIYVPAFILAVLYHIYYFSLSNGISSNSLNWMPEFRTLGAVTRIFTLFCAIGMISFLIHSLFKAPNILARQRARIIVFGVTIGFFAPVILMVAVYALKINFPWNFLVLFIVFFPATIAYSIIRHNLFDADRIIRQTVGYVLVTATVVGAYGLITVSFNVFMGKYQVAQSRAFPILFTLGVILVFNPLRDRIQSLVDRIFFRKEYDYGEIIDKIGGAITSLIDLGQILKRLTQTFIEDMFINTTSVMLLSPDGTAYQVYLADGEDYQDLEKTVINRNEPIVAIIEKEKKELTKNDVLEDPKFRDVSESCAEKFDNLRASLIVPLVFQDKVIGMLSLGEKKSGKFYKREDIDLLHALSNQGAVAIENARLFQENLEKQRMEEELAIGRELQMSMLPTTCPEIENFDIAAFSASAREVGGDFYDFIEISKKKLGIVIGDVTGKSVSGALVMSASRSIFRMLGENNLTVSESMISANRRTKKDIKRGMFVALLYAVLSAENKSISLCSAGQTQPVYVSAATGEADLVETKGDTFPLGILDEAQYEETHMQLETGDKVVLYTDGVVEAMNAQEEMFGFDRLIEIIKESKTMTAEALLSEIKKEVDGFTGSAPQHDDITIIVVQAV